MIFVIQLAFNANFLKNLVQIKGVKIRVTFITFNDYCH
jgi:hypothetical protein